MTNVLFPLNISQSVLSDMYQCEVYFFRKWCQGLFPPKSSDLIAGSHFANACEIARNSFYKDNLELDECIEKGYNYILNEVDTGDTIKSNERVAFCFKKYLEKYPLNISWKPCLLEDGSYSVEYYFEFDLGITHPDLPDRNIIFSGKLDMLGQINLPNGKTIFAVVDEKTCNRVTRINETKVIDLVKEEEKYRASGQLIGYAFACDVLGIKVEKGFIRRVPILKDYTPSFELAIDINPYMIEAWSMSMINKVREYVEKYKYYKETGKLFACFSGAFTDACNPFGRTCEYKDGCTMKEGEELLIQRYGQNYLEPKTKERLLLSDKIKEIKT